MAYRDIESAIDESASHEERAVTALESIADALTAWVKLEQQKFDKLYPVKVPRDATATKLPSEEDRLREDLGSTNEPLDEWIGLREQKVISKKK